MAKVKTKDVMSRDVVTVHASDTIHEALDLMVENRVSALPVINGRRHCVGILSTSDMIDMTRDMDSELSEIDEIDGSRLWIVEKISSGIGREPVSSAMTETVASVTPETPVKETAREMLRHRVHRLPVVDGNQVLVGIVSTMDILSALAETSD